jgi:hypothetical protein
MHVLFGIAVVIIAALFLLGAVSRARENARGTAQPKGPSGRLMRAAAHPANRQALAAARADAVRVWEAARSTDWLEQRRHERATTAKGGSAPAARAAPAPDSKWHVPGHEADPHGRIRRPVAKALDATGTWRLLPSRAQSALCGCPACKGSSAPGSTANGDGTAPAANGTKPAIRVLPRQQAARTPPAAPSGGTTVSAGTSTASAEKLIEGINEIHAHAAAGGIHAKREAILAAHECAVRFAAMLQMLSRTLAERHYGPEITEPLASAATHITAGRMSISESDATLTSMLNMTVDALGSSPRQAPVHTELSETGSN